MWTGALRLLLPLLDGLAYMLPFLAPAFLGAAWGYRSLKPDERRKLGIIGAVSLIVWSTIGGAAMVPIAAHFTGVPEIALNSLAVLLAIAGAKGTDALLIVRRAKKALSESDERQT